MPMVLVSEISNSVKEKSLKSQGIFFVLICGNPAVVVFFRLVTINYRI